MRYASMFSLILAVGLMCSFTNGPVSLSPQAEPGVMADLPWGGAYLVFAGKFGGKVTKKQLEGQCEVQVDGCARGSRIFTFTLELSRAGKKTTYTSDSNALTDEMMAGLQALRVGDTFSFKKTKAYLPNGKDVVDVHSREFVVV